MIKLRKQIEQIEALAKRKLTKEALARYNNLKMAHPEKAVQAAVFIVQASQQSIDDGQLKKLLILMEKEKKQTKIKRV